MPLSTVSFQTKVNETWNTKRIWVQVPGLGEYGKATHILNTDGKWKTENCLLMFNFEPENLVDEWGQESDTSAFAGRNESPQMLQTETKRIAVCWLSNLIRANSKDGNEVWLPIANLWCSPLNSCLSKVKKDNRWIKKCYKLEAEMSELRSRCW